MDFICHRVPSLFQVTLLVWLYPLIPGENPLPYYVTESQGMMNVKAV